MSEQESSNATQEAAPYYSDLPEDLRHNPSIQKFDSYEAMARGYVAAQGLIGGHGNKVEVSPGMNMEARKEIFSRMGLPKEPTIYDFKATDTMPEAISPGSAFGQHLAKVSHEVGILPDQAQALYEKFEPYYASVAAEAEQTKAAATTKVDEELKAAWGDQYDSNLDAAVLATEKLGIKEDIAEHIEYLNPNIMTALMKVGEMMTEDSAIGGTNRGSASGSDQLAEEMKEVSRQMYTTKDMAARNALELKHKELGNKFTRQNTLTPGMNFGSIEHLIQR